ncbi:MAG TPA: amino acid ABC transporter permease [Methylomusa anaerophila]|uniref:Putative glutamine ABC transporter permease protein GlnM n=1 Tax=Methylomusa anaerophila TaxID=1930071 RepID=A0A348ANQ9_9FIRM|nr:amino acid ABC transporter permease [Methylomusa anaerophila]BBB92707.1 putative glutamine ABC transporter permease protein GlnM [Methylomusa anaerophila]HML87440.1 amino acid ABC transporter permease [Methylomusa anaerophila]
MNGPFAGFKWLALFQDWRIFAEGFGVTLALSFLALVLSLILGILFGVLGAAQWKGFKVINRIYVEFIQNTPLVIQIFFLYHALPHVGIMLPVFVVGVLGVGVYHGAYMAEVVRAGIQAVPKGQLEAAYSQGFSYWQAMSHVILPQAKRMSFPPLTNQAVNLIKNTSVLAMVAGGELMYHADSWSSTNLYYGPTYVVTGLLYLAICFPLATYARRLERRLEVSS